MLDSRSSACLRRACDKVYPHGPFELAPLHTSAMSSHESVVSELAVDRHVRAHSDREETRQLRA
jgi:hypothetical protein